MEYKVKIDAFEGPLDLLLHLIKEFEIDIYDIPVAEITDQYLHFIHDMQVLELNVASEYLVMAATLIAMKSRMLLPRPEPVDESEDDVFEDAEDSRQMLMRRLQEYKQFKEMAATLRESETDRLLFFSKPADVLEGIGKNLLLIPKSERSSTHDLMRAFQHMLQRRRLEMPLTTKIDRQSLPIGRQMSVLMSRLKKTTTALSFSALCDAYDRSSLVVTFLALLELMKKRAIKCTQADNFAEIQIGLGEEAGQFDGSNDMFDY
ncbi:MAG: segregation/condensation protein A [Sporolactobacillus sp.]